MGNLPYFFKEHFLFPLTKLFLFFNVELLSEFLVVCSAEKILTELLFVMVFLWKGEKWKFVEIDECFEFLIILDVETEWLFVFPLFFFSIFVLLIL